MTSPAWAGVGHLALFAVSVLMAAVYAIQAAFIRSDRALPVIAVSFVCYGTFDLGLALSSELGGVGAAPAPGAAMLALVGVCAAYLAAPFVMWHLLDVRLDRVRWALLLGLGALAAARCAEAGLFTAAHPAATWEQLQASTSFTALPALLGAAVVTAAWTRDAFAARKQSPALGWLVFAFGAATLLATGYAVLMAVGLLPAVSGGGFGSLRFVVFVHVVATLRFVSALRSASRPAGDIDRYQVLRRIGAGGMGDVFLARRRGPAGFLREVVLKTLRTADGSDREARERFLLEARTAAQLRHPNIVDVYDLGQHPGGYFLVMEHVEGATLSQLGRRASKAGGALPADVVAEVGVQVCRGLGYAHAQGVVHRDIKHQNVMISVRGVVKLIDFGIAQLQGGDRAALAATVVGPADAPTGRLTDADGVAGTAGYVSPERLRGGPASAASDLFSLGIVLYELLTDRRPFDAPDGEGFVAQVEAGRFERLPAATGALGRAVERCLAAEPRDRPASALALQLELEEFLQGRRVDLASALAPLFQREAGVAPAPPDAPAGPSTAETVTAPAEVKTVRQR